MPKSPLQACPKIKDLNLLKSFTGLWRAWEVWVRIQKRIKHEVVRIVSRIFSFEFLTGVRCYACLPGWEIDGVKMKAQSAGRGCPRSMVLKMQILYCATQEIHQASASWQLSAGLHRGAEQACGKSLALCSCCCSSLCFWKGRVTQLVYRLTSAVLQ